MTDLVRIDLVKFKEACASARNNFSVLTDADFAMVERAGHTRRSWFKNMIDADEFRLPEQASVKTTEELCSELRSSLRVAARSAMGWGATNDQIDRIVALAEDSGNFNIGQIGRLTRAEANHIIRSMEAE